MVVTLFFTLEIVYCCGFKERRHERGEQIEQVDLKSEIESRKLHSRKNAEGSKTTIDSMYKKHEEKTVDWNKEQEMSWPSTSTFTLGTPSNTPFMQYSLGAPGTPTPFQTPPLSNQSYTTTPEHAQFMIDPSMTPVDEEMPEIPIQPPELYRDTIEDNSASSEELFQRPQGPFIEPTLMNSNADWSDDDDREEWSDANWSEEEVSNTRKNNPQQYTKPATPSFSRIFNQTRIAMTPRSQEINQILNDLMELK